MASTRLSPRVQSVPAFSPSHSPLNQSQATFDNDSHSSANRHSFHKSIEPHRKRRPPSLHIILEDRRIDHHLRTQSEQHLSSVQFPTRKSSLRPSRSPRLPRHVPIIIPDHAQPCVPQLLRPSPSKTSLRLTATTPTSATDATKSPQDPPKSSKAEKRSPIYFSTMNTSQVSLSAASESGAESVSGTTPQMQSGGMQNVSMSASMSQQTSTAGIVPSLVCNVYRTTGREPQPLIGATTTVLGDKLYVFGGRISAGSKSTLTADLYELDLIRRHWTKVECTGDVPPPRYFHSICALGDTKLVCYGGMSPSPQVRAGANGQSNAKAQNEPQAEVVVMSDIHVYDVNTRVWTEVISSGSDSPEGRYAHCASILPSSAVFTSADAPTSAIHHNPPSSDPHSGTLGVQIDGAGGAEMVVVGGQDGANNYIEEISVFNLRSLKWTSSTPYGRKCGAYKSMVTGLPGVNAQAIGSGQQVEDTENRQTGSAMLIYSNYNFLDVKLELRVRMPDGSLMDKPMAGNVSPPGLRFPNGGVINGHFVISGTYLTSSKHEYTLWALDLRTLTWAPIDTAGSVFSQGSWNRGVLWNRRNTYIILGHRKRSLVEDYNHRRINFAHLCSIELEAFGLYENSRRAKPTSAYLSNSAPAIPASLQASLPSRTAGGRKISSIAEQLGQTALSINELCDMEIIAHGGEKIPCSSHILSRRWGPFFNQLMLDSTNPSDNSTIDGSTLRPTNSQTSRMSAITITPAINGTSTTHNDTTSDDARAPSRSTARTLIDPPSALTTSNASTRPRTLYLPHMSSTIRLLLHYLYTSSLPPLTNPLCSPNTLCSLLQMARPYQIDGLQEATIERLHEVLDSRNAAAVFNAAAMAAGGGRVTGLGSGVGGGTLAALERRESQATAIAEGEEGKGGRRRLGMGHRKTNSGDSTSTATSMTASTEFSTTDNEGDGVGGGQTVKTGREIWRGDVSSVIGLQKRGLRGLMEGRRLRERATPIE